jgi:hydrogenase maturation protease
MSTMAINQCRIAVFGLGNLLLGDDGFGPCFIELFRCRYDCGSDVEILDLGTPGCDVAPYLYGRDLVVIADAMDAPCAPGTLCLYKYKEAPPHGLHLRLTDHESGLSEAFAQLTLLGQAPAELIVVGAVPKSCGFNEGISGDVLKACSTAVDHVACLLRDRGVRCVPRTAPESPNLWWLSGSGATVPASEVQTRG